MLHENFESRQHWSSPFGQLVFVRDGWGFTLIGTNRLCLFSWPNFYLIPSFYHTELSSKLQELTDKEAVPNKGMFKHWNYVIFFQYALWNIGTSPMEHTFGMADGSFKESWAFGRRGLLTKLNEKGKGWCVWFRAPHFCEIITQYYKWNTWILRNFFPKDIKINTNFLS